MTSSEITWPEPAPNWSEAKKMWKWGWEFHVFGFATLYSLVALYTIFNICSQGNFYLRKQKLHTLFLNCLLLFFSFTRAALLFGDPYGSRGTSVEILLCCVIFQGLATSCVTSAFSVMLLILLETTKVSLAPPRFQKFSFLLGIWAINVTYLLISDLTVAWHNSAKVMVFVCQVMFATWGLIVSIGYMVTTVKIRKNLRSSRETARHNANFSNESAKIHQLTKLMCVASVDGFCLFAMSIYVASSESGVLNKSGRVEIWPWFGIQTSFRLAELLMCLIIFRIALKSGSNERRRVSVQRGNSLSLQMQEIAR